MKRSLENNLKTNGSTIANTRTYKQIMKRSIAETVVQKYIVNIVNNVFLEISQSS